MEAHDEAWNTWFAAEGIAPLRLAYERLAEDPAGELTRVCTALGVAAPHPQEVTPGVARLADEVSEEWIRRFSTDRDSR